jgi:hypothetical protein
MEKKGWVRIVESFISLLIILFALLFFVSHQHSKNMKEEKVKEVIRATLENIEKNYTLRDAIKNNNIFLLNDSISFLLKNYPQYDFSFCIVNSTQNCFPQEARKQIYSDSILISYEENNGIVSKKFVLFLWEK